MVKHTFDKGYEAKKCTKCCEIKALDLFKFRAGAWDNLQSRCISCYRKANNARMRSYYKDPEKVEQYRNISRQSQKRNQVKNRPVKAARFRQRYHEDKEFRLKHLLRSRLHTALRAQGVRKRNGTMALVGCSSEELFDHLESQFVTGMSWENMGSEWHVDHIMPCASFDLCDAGEQKRCFHWSNLQPLFAKENLSKGAKTNWTRNPTFNPITNLSAISP